MGLTVVAKFLHGYAKMDLRAVVALDGRVHMTVDALY